MRRILDPLEQIDVRRLCAQRVAAELVLELALHARLPEARLARIGQTELHRVGRRPALVSSRNRSRQWPGLVCVWHPATRA